MTRSIVFVTIIILLLTGCSPAKEKSQIQNQIADPVLQAESEIKENLFEEDNSNVSTHVSTNVYTNVQNNANGDNPVIPTNGKDLDAFIPEEWEVKSSVVGDLNNDSMPDIVAVIEKNGDIDILFPRILFVLLQDKDREYKLSVKTATAIMRANEGGVWGDPFESISIERGSILLSFYGGSNWRWYGVYRFRFQDNGFYLIGATLGSYFTGTTTKDNADEEDYNLLTGDYVIKKADEEGNVNTKKGNRGKRKLTDLNDFIVDSVEKQF